MDVRVKSLAMAYSKVGKPVRFVSVLLGASALLLALLVGVMLFSSRKAEQGLEETLNARVEQYAAVRKRCLITFTLLRATFLEI